MRTDESCCRLIDKLYVFPIIRYYADGWQSSRKYIPSEKHFVRKENTWRIERINLNFRTHVKRLNCKLSVSDK
ncbi:MAG: IS1 family transposase [Candidatus Electronema sp. VV]